MKNYSVFNLLPFLIQILILILILISSIGCADNSQYQKNQLSKESSPYLLQHANNPVHWQAWNEKTLARAQKEQKPIIISVGYAACHWCHVMEEESFEDSTVANLMNEHFINIKVDREERPDIDQIYMTACQLATNESCGWPLNAMALPDGRPFWATTYLPKNNWLKALTYFKDLYDVDKEKVIEAANRLEQGIASMNLLPSAKDPAINADKLRFWNERMIGKIDTLFGGRSGSPKFPLPGLLEYLQKSGVQIKDTVQLEIVDNSLRQIANGGIYDHVGGGFARYSTDEEWHIPHFEKMLYDNAQLIGLYSQAYRRTRSSLYHERVDETIAFILEHWKDEEGGFYSSYDADSYNKVGQKEEGAFYVWQFEEIIEILGEAIEVEAFCALFDIRKEGNWEAGKNVLHQVDTENSIARQFGLDVLTFQKFVTESLDRLSLQRSKRTKPTLDNKILCNWNALLVSGLVEAYKSFENPKYIAEAIELAAFIEAKMLQADGSIKRSIVDGQPSIDGFLDDYVFLAQACIDLYQVTFDQKWFDLAVQLEKYVQQNFFNINSKTFEYTRINSSNLPLKTKDYSDNVIPGAISSTANLLFEIGTLTGNAAKVDQAQMMLRQAIGLFEQSSDPGFYYEWMNLFHDLAHPPFEVAILGNDHKEILRALQKEFLPNVLFLGGDDEHGFDLLQNKLIEGQTMIYVCKNKVCKLPTEDYTIALAQILAKN